MKRQRREEEAKILAEMEEAMRENTQPAQENEPKRIGLFKDKTPETWHCHKCGVLMENGKCPQCGHTVYVPMSDKMKKTVRWVIGGICVAAFVIVLIWTR